MKGWLYRVSPWKRIDSAFLHASLVFLTNPKWTRSTTKSISDRHFLTRHSKGYSIAFHHFVNVWEASPIRTNSPIFGVKRR